MDYRKDIQGLRAIAVLSVFIFHLNSSWLPGGFIGVDIFFVISGFLISSIIFHKVDENKFSFIDFYRSRIKRIVPAYFFLLLTVAIVGIIIFVVSDIRGLRKAYFWSLLFNSNSYFTTIDTYFGASSNENPFLHTWTLAVEMKFYLFLPLIIFIKKKWTFPIITALTIAIFAYATIEIVMNNNKGLMYFSLLARTPEFLIGVLASMLYTKTISLHSKKRLIMSTLGLFFIITSLFLIDENSYFPGALSIIPCLGTALLLIAPINPIRTFLSNKTLFFIGELSYSIYLWHWPIMAFIRYYYNIYTFSLFQVILILILTFLLSMLSLYCIEKPLRKIKSKSFWILLLSLISINIAVLLSILKINKMLNNLPIEYLTPSFGMSSHGDTFKSVGILGDTLSNNNILLVGDSHALSMKYYFDYLGKQNAFSVKTITNNTYPPIPGLKKEDFSESRYYDQYLNLLKYSEPEIEKSDIIIMQYAVRDTACMAIIDNLLKHLKPRQYFILLSDFPTLDKNPAKINRDIIKNRTKDQSYKINFAVSEDIINLVESYPNTYYLDLSKSKAFENAPFYNDTLMYYDQGHLNIFGSKIYAKETGYRFMNVLNEIIDKQVK